MAKNRIGTAEEPGPDGPSREGQSGNPVPRSRSLTGRAIQEGTDDEVVAILRDLYEQHLESLWCSIGLGMSLGSSDVAYMRLYGRRLARARRLLGPERYERLVGPIREEWAVKLREAHADQEEREDLEAESSANLNKPRRSSAQGMNPFRDNDVDD